jgi:predicted RNA-binding Zn-ribbon protein involved in translation (DUF1610 family)
MDSPDYSDKHTRVFNSNSCCMQDKRKVTLYIPPDVHRKLKIRAAVDSEPMSTLAQRAIVFYLTHPDVVDGVELSHGQNHRVYNCPECSSDLIVRDGEMVSLKASPAVLSDEFQVSSVDEEADSDRQDRGELVTC